MNDKLISGNLVVVEGPENTGKSSLAKALTARLNQRNIRAVYTSFPGQEPKTIGQLVYYLEHKRHSFELEPLLPSVRQLLHLAAHGDAIERRIKPQLESGTWVVLDRYTWSLVAHGKAQGVDDGLLQQLVAIEEQIWNPVVPVLIVATLQRAPFTEEVTEAWLTVASAYHEIAKSAPPQRTLLTSAEMSLDDRVNSCMAFLEGASLIASQ